MEITLLAGFAVVVATLAWRSRGWPLAHDAPIMHYIAWRISEGAAPYRDLFDMNFPGVYLLHLAVLGLFGPGDLAWRLFDLGWLVLGGLAVAALAAAWGTVAAVGGALVFAAHHLAGGPWQAGQRDFLLCPLLLLGALGVARWLERRRGLADLAWGGLALGVGITMKPHPALFAGALAVAVIFIAWRSGTGPGAPLVFVAGVAAPPLAVLAWLAALGALPAWRAIVVDYLIPLYSLLGRPDAWGHHRWHVWIPLGVAALGSLASAVVARRFGARHAVAAAGLAYGLMHYVGQGKGWEYHLYPLAAFAAVLAFGDLDRLLRTRCWASGLAIAASLALVTVLIGIKGAEAAAAAEGGWVSDKARRAGAVVGDLAGRLRPGDRVQVLDTTEGGLHALLRLRVAQPTRFVYDFHFFHDVDAPAVQRLRDEFARDLAARSPRFIVLFRQGWPAGGVERVDAFPALRDRLVGDYRISTRGDGYLIYEQRDHP